MPAKIIVFEGLDCSYKETNTNLLKKYLTERGYKVALHDFPNYERESSYFIKQYLTGKYGEANDVDPYIASLFYSLDRYDTYKSKIEKDYNEMDYIIFDRYTGSNVIYQGAKIKGRHNLRLYIKWLIDLEFNTMKLPRSNITIFLNNDINIANALMAEKNKDDIHENNSDLQTTAYNICQDIVWEVGWNKVECAENGQVRSKEDIFSDIIKILKEKGIIENEEA